MTLILETGGGVRDSNSYVTTAFIDTYLSERNRSTENSWSTGSTAEKEAAAIAATQYIDSRWGDRFKGTRLTTWDGQQAVAQVTFGGLAVADETITIGYQTYTWKAALDDISNDQILIGATAAECATNLVYAVTGGGTAGTEYSTYMDTNGHVTAVVNSDDSTIVDLTALQKGLAGNNIALTETMTNLTVGSTFVFGKDEASQALAFPRNSLYTSDGEAVVGVPRNLMWATAEYAVRAMGSALFQDPTVASSGRSVVREKVGPIETEYAETTGIDTLIKPYPAADQLLADYVAPTGGVIRG